MSSGPHEKYVQLKSEMFAQVIRDSRQVWRSKPAEVQQRVELLEGSFFDVGRSRCRVKAESSDAEVGLKCKNGRSRS